MYHFFRIILLLIVIISLLKSTVQILRGISRGSEIKQFKKELWNTILAFSTFVICYVGWIGYYIYEFCKEFTASEQKEAHFYYWDQLHGMLFSGFLFSVLPILVLFYIHF